MSDPIVPGNPADPALDAPSGPTAREAMAGIAKFWWVFLIAGALWLVVAAIILRFNTSSLATVGYIVGFMLIVAGIEQFLLASAVEGGWKWVWLIFGIFFVIGGTWAVFNPVGTTASLAYSLGLLFALIALLWIVEAFATKRSNSLWWLTLVSGLIMAGLAIWAGGQLFGTKVVTLLVFAGVWAIVQGIGDFVRAFELRKLGKLVAARS